MAHKMTYRTDLQQQEILFTEKNMEQVLTNKRKEYFHDFTANGFSLLFYCYTLCSKILVLVMSRSTKVQVKLNIVE